MKWEMVLANLRCDVCIFLERRDFAYILCFSSGATVRTDHMCADRNSLESTINTGEPFKFKTVAIAVEDILY